MTPPRQKEYQFKLWHREESRTDLLVFSLWPYISEILYFCEYCRYRKYDFLFAYLEEENVKTSTLTWNKLSE